MNRLFNSIFFFCLMLGISNIAFGQDNLEQAKILIKQLEQNSPDHDGVPLNRYFITDINFDGDFEVIERVNEIENNWTGILNIEMAPAFDYDNIYRFENGKFKENYSNYDWYLSQQLAHYELWKNLLSDPKNLSSDSQSFLEVNKENLMNEINRLIQLTNNRKSE